MSNKLALSKEDARLVISHDHDDWEPAGTNKIVGQRRWVVTYSNVFKHTPTGRFYKLTWRRGATEQQDEKPFEYDDPEPIEVTLQERVVKVWVAVK